MSKSNLIIEHSLNFALKSISVYKLLQNENEFIISKQFLKSSTSIGANVCESKYAQSKKDFIHKMSIAIKEARETEYWLTLLKKSELTKLDCNHLIEDVQTILKILTAIIVSSKRNLEEKNNC